MVPNATEKKEKKNCFDTKLTILVDTKSEMVLLEGSMGLQETPVAK